MTTDRTTERTAEIRHEVVVALDVDHAFDAFVDLDRIKPREHNLLAVDIERTVVEREVGGAIYDRGVDGSTCRWGRVLAFDPPRLFRFSWDIGLDWQVIDDPDRASEVEVTFEPADAGTRVVLVHRHLDRHGPGWESMRDGVDGPQGWPLYLGNLERLGTMPR
jgi:uncharacterized protein YndB with AHSA1/START domain